MKMRRNRFLTALLALAIVPTNAVGQDATWRDPVSGIDFIRVAAGCFDMGQEKVGTAAQDYPNAMPDELPRHRVCMDEFWVGRTEVTNSQWERVMGKRGGRPQQPDQAVSDINWGDAQAFVAKLTKAAREASPEHRHFRLPTEAEWEYVCHAGNPRPVFQGDVEALRQLYAQLDQVAWFKYPDFPDRVAHLVALKQPNAWGLYDTLGNVFEWVEDDYRRDGYSNHAERNPVIAESGNHKVIRGGSYKTNISGVRCGMRQFVVSSERLPHLGLRVVMKK
jgi:formylglycine-generating enzyme required for sulfatase activity